MGSQMTPLIPLKQVLISFAGYEFLAVQLPGGKIAVVFRHFCEALGLKTWSQIRRIQANPVLARHLLLVLIQTPGGPQVVNALVVSVLSLWLGGFDLTRLSEEKRTLIITLMEDAEEAFSRPFVVTPIEPPQQPKAPPPQPPQPPVPAQDQAPVSVYDLLHAAIHQMEQEHQEVKRALARIERQQNEEVAWKAEKGHELDRIGTICKRRSGEPFARRPSNARSIAARCATATRRRCTYITAPTSGVGTSSRRTYLSCASSATRAIIPNSRSEAPLRGLNTRGETLLAPCFWRARAAARLEMPGCCLRIVNEVITNYP